MPLWKHSFAGPGRAWLAAMSRAWLLALALGTLLCAPARAGAERNVLVLYSLGTNAASTWQTQLHEGMQEELSAHDWGAKPVIYEERLDGVRVGEAEALASMAPYLRVKYARVRLDAIISENYLAARFLSEHPELFPGVPRYYVNHGRRDWRPGDGNGYEVNWDFDRSLGVIATVAPAVRRVVVVGDRSARVQDWIAAIRAVAPRLRDRLVFEYWDQLSFEELYRKAAALGADSAIFLLPTYQDRDGLAGVPSEIAQRLSTLAPVPIFVHIESLVLPGIAGGYVLSGKRVGKAVAQLIQGVAANVSDVQEYVFDYPTVQRFRLAPLPAPLKWLNRPDNLWELYRWQIVGGLALIVLEALLITALVRTLRSRRRALATLHDERAKLEANVVQRTLELLVANNQLKLLATTDPLTGIGNRRRMTEQINTELERCRRFGQPLSLLMVDIDHFKHVNDNFGHEAGDRAIIAVARALTEDMRSIDLASRFGGEEFVLLMPQTRAEVAAGAAERLRAAVAALQLRGDDGEAISLTISIGVASAEPGGEADTASSLLVRADRALYRAKDEGRNRVCRS